MYVYVVRHLLRARTSTSCAQPEALRRAAASLRDARDNTLDTVRILTSLSLSTYFRRISSPNLSSEILSSELTALNSFEK